MKMRTRRITITGLAVVLVLMLIAGASFQTAPQLAHAQDPAQTDMAAPQALTLTGNAITYQGYLTDGGSPANGIYDFSFSLYADAAGTQWVGDAAVIGDVVVVDGLFTVEADFDVPGYGDIHFYFNGEARYLRVGVRPGASTGAFTHLSPLQPLTPAPYAQALPGLHTIQNDTSPNVVGGYPWNSVGLGQIGATISGGGHETGINTVYADYGTVGGGRINTASGDDATVSGGASNTASAGDAAVGGGEGNTASGVCAVVAGGCGNMASNTLATVGGGDVNFAQGERSTIGGGSGNSAPADFTTIGGGFENQASDVYATVAGGEWNEALGIFSTVAGGQANMASGGTSTVCGGTNNVATGNSATVAGGYINAADDHYATVGGGRHNEITGEYGTIAGGGGMTLAEGNRVTNNYSTIGGGSANTVGGNYATISGGDNNSASGSRAVVGGGNSHVASGNYSTVAGGYNNTTSGMYAMVPGGNRCTAQGTFSFAAGRQAKAYNTGCFVWGDSSTTSDVTCNNDHRWVARTSGGVYFYTNSGLTSGVQVVAGGNAWSSVSDRSLKENFKAVDNVAILERLVAQVPVSTWNYQSQDPSVRHIGPMAQDLYSAFGLGEDAQHISTVDADGVALAAVQGLYQLLEEKESLISEQQAQIVDLEARVVGLEQVMAVSRPSSFRLPEGWWALAGLVVIAGVVVCRKRKRGDR